jgi:cysteinyl-tRNA synthetase
MLHITNTLTGKKEPFSPQKKAVALYVCGITPYSPAHIGHGRCYISFDVLYRLLPYLGYTVDYCRNVTDIDDKLLNRAQEELGDRMRYQELAKHFFALFKKSLNALNCLEPKYEPLVTDHIPEIVDFIQGLIDKQHAYAIDGDVYFSIATYKNYGHLSKQKLKEMQPGSRVAIRTEKRDPLDFVLWKGEPDDIFWQSPWGNGRPGWHIECSALAARYLGEHLDIHAGGLDLIFPHHENEITQSESLFGAPFARYWMHNGLVTVDGEKMSKSLGNFIVLDDLLSAHEPALVRYYFLTYHYKSPAEFSYPGLAVAKKSYERLVNVFADTVPTEVSRNQINQYPVLAQMFEMMCDDVNTPGMFGVLFEHIDLMVHDEKLRAVTLYFLQTVLGLTFIKSEAKQIVMTPEIERMLTEREMARSTQNWQKADELRLKLVELGIDVHDKKK